MSQFNPRTIEQRPPVEHFCTTNDTVVKTSMEWTILNFNLLKFDTERCLKSSNFEPVEDGISTGTWHMKLVTKPIYADDDGKISVFLVYSGNRRDLFVGLDVWIVDVDGKATNKKKLCLELDSKEVEFHNFIKKSSLVDSLLPNGNLTLHCFVAVVPLNTKEVKRGRPNADNSPTVVVFSNLLKDGIFSDAVLVCGYKRFPVHKCILSARSAVFRKMFQQNIEDEINIENMDADVLEILLYYIYCDNIVKKCTVNLAVKLLKGAEKYCLFELKDICERFLEANISAHNLFEVASVADLHNLHSLKEACISFMFAQGKEIIFSCNFMEFLSTVPRYLLDGVFRAIFEGSESLERKRLATFKPSPLSTSLQFAACTPGLRDGQQLAMVKGTQSSKCAATTIPNLRDAMGQAVVKGGESSPKETIFQFGLSKETHPVFPPKKKAPK